MPMIEAQGPEGCTPSLCHVSLLRFGDNLCVECAYLPCVGKRSNVSQRLSYPNETVLSIQ